ncbi:MAG: tetratricopeptide repeat protein [Vallitalea sp.]|jgi:tetratricopeptide (TPR) repeat protein|nr:tetratricopeptide repeat protein [Vallitalea sp.]
MTEENINNENNYNNFNDDLYSYGCKNCGSSIIEEGYNTNLCVNCRDKLSKRPIPKKIKFVFLVVLGLVLYSLIRFPAVLEGAIAYERGEQAAEQKKYTTALKEFEKAAKKYSYSGNLKAKLIITQYYTGNYDHVIDMLVDLEGTTIESDELYSQLEEINEDLIGIYALDDELNNIIASIKNESVDIKIQKLSEYNNLHPKNIMSAYMLANIYCGIEDYEQAKFYLNKMLRQRPDNQYALINMSEIEKVLGNYEDAINYCNHVLDINVESADAYASLAKIELARLNDEKALEYIEIAYEINSNSLSILSTLAETYHHTNMLEKRDEILDKIINHPDISKEDKDYIESLYKE